MGIVNVTPDSFSDGGRWLSTTAAVEHALQLIDAGAAIVDIGGESTRPGAVPVSVDEELHRVVPVVSALKRQNISAIISVDTRHAPVIQAVIDAGADMINDVQALSALGAIDCVKESKVAVCLMHMQGQPVSMQQVTQYADVVTEVNAYLCDRVSAVMRAGIDRQRIMIDPGIGFGKQLQHNLQLLHHLDTLVKLGFPVLVGASRKTMLGEITGQAVAAREFAGIAANLYAIKQGAKILRVHDVAACRDAILVWQAIEDAI